MKHTQFGVVWQAEGVLRGALSLLVPGGCLRKAFPDAGFSFWVSGLTACLCVFSNLTYLSCVAG